jgi:hypothetical protein
MLTGSADGAGQRLTAKVADFGLSFPLPPTDTHATLVARVRRRGQKASRRLGDAKPR